MSLSYRYSGSVDTNLAQDIRRIDLILNQQRPDYKDVKISVDPQELIDTEFSTGSSYCKAILCLLAYQEPKDFHNDGKVNLDNAWLKIASSKNYHHFFPKKFLKDSGIQNSNSLMNITFVSANLNKSLIRAKPPSKYIAEFQISNNDIAVTLKTHLIELNDFGIQNDDYEAFLNARANNIFRELDARINI